MAASSTEQRRLLDAFVRAAHNGDVADLERLLASDVVSTSDGGGLVRLPDSQSSAVAA
jgi:RNA polymerase sigma-70 factor (ECF subfamily)